jgi:hypothetical protein
LAAAEALFATFGAPPAGAAAPSATVRPGASVAVETSNMGQGYGLNAHGWMPLGLHTAIRAGAQVGWAKQKQPAGEVANAIIPQLELAIALRPQVRLPRGWPEAELRLFVAPAVSLMSGLPAADAGQRAWTITTGYGWSNFWRTGHTLIGAEPRPSWRAGTRSRRYRTAAVSTEALRREWSGAVSLTSRSDSSRLTSGGPPT